MTEPLEPGDRGVRIRMFAAFYAGDEYLHDSDDDDREIRRKKRQLAGLEALQKDLEAEIAEVRAELEAESQARLVPETAVPSEEQTKLTCSFCGKSEEQVNRLLHGPDAHICNECIDLCNEIFDEEDPEHPLARQQELESLVSDLRSLVDSQEHLVEEQRTFVERYSTVLADLVSSIARERPS